MGKLRSDALQIWNAGVDAVRAKPLVCREVKVSGDELRIGDHRWSRSDFDRIIIVGAGKAATAMAEGLIESIGSWLPCAGWINVPAGTEKELPGVTVHPARPPGVNEPTAEGVAGTKEILHWAGRAGARDLCIALISGGGSALMPAPVAGISLEDKLAVTRFLSGAGADITQLNTVRKHLSRVKGGGLLRACRAGHLVTLVLSDVLGDPLDLIASGPTVPDTSSPADALNVLREFDPDHALPQRITDVLASAAQQAPPASPGPQCAATTLVLGNNALAVDQAGLRAERLGYNHAMQSARQCEGAAENVGRHLAQLTAEMLRRPADAHPTDCLITGGEPTVTLPPESVRGLGGRNLQLVLAAYQRLLSMELTDQQWDHLCILSGGTDGEDGPTDAAGAVLDGDVHRLALRRGLDVGDYLRRCDAYHFFQQVGGLVTTGPTGTNVCDLRVCLGKADIHPDRMS